MLYLVCRVQSSSKFCEDKLVAAHDHDMLDAGTAAAEPSKVFLLLIKWCILFEIYVLWRIEVSQGCRSCKIRHERLYHQLHVAAGMG